MVENVNWKIKNIKKGVRKKYLKSTGIYIYKNPLDAENITEMLFFVLLFSFLHDELNKLYAEHQPKMVDTSSKSWLTLLIQK